MFSLHSSFSPTGDQPEAIEKLTAGVLADLKNQVLLGVTGSGKTFTMANVIKNTNLPTLIISHNKTLAGQLYQEFRDFFPENVVSYFVSYYDFYQPEAYIPTTDTYIEKEAEINELIDKLRLAATTNILTRKDVIVVASVSCIYNIGSPKEYGNFIVKIAVGDEADWNKIARRLVELQYDRSDYEFRRGSFRIRGEYMDVWPAYEDHAYRVIQMQNANLKMQNDNAKIKNKKSNLTIQQFSNLMIDRIVKIDPVSGQEKEEVINAVVIYPAKHFMMNPEVFESAEKQIRADLTKESTALKAAGKEFEARRLIQKVNYDLEMIKEVGYVNGIENYSRYFDGRKQGDPPFSLIDYFKEQYGDEFLTIIDESHMTVPQIRGMYNGDHARKQTLIDFGFRLHSALDNRPMKFEEFYQAVPRIVYVSATPDEWEITQVEQEIQGDLSLRSRAASRLKQSSQESTRLPRRPASGGAPRNDNVQFSGVVEQLVRPTGIVDPEIEVRPAKDEVTDLIAEIEKRIKYQSEPQKILVTTLTKKMAEDLSVYLKEKNVRAEYLHSDIKTLERSDILDKLRRNEFDVLIGVNLLREGLDLPEVSLVAILDADKEGFLRSRVSLIQTMGRAARNIEGKVILYADEMTGSMNAAIEEIGRRRKYQLEYNKKHKITPISIVKPVREKIVEAAEILELAGVSGIREHDKMRSDYLDRIKPESLTPFDKKKLAKRLEREMKRAAEDLNFELAIKMRDKVKELQQ
jgi:excinuclease ABC subunit B